MTINFYLVNNSNPDAEYHTIYVYVRGLVKGKTFYANIGEKIKPILWDKDKQHAKKSFIGSPELNRKIMTIRSGLTENLTNIETSARLKGEHLSSITVKKEIDRYFNKTDNIEKTLIENLDLFKEIRRGDISPAFLEKFENLKNHLLDFEAYTKYRISFDSINLLFYDKFRNYQWKVKGNVNTTTYGLIHNLKIFLNWCTERGINTNTEYKRFKVLSSKVDTVHLTSEELFAIFNLDLSKSNRLASVRDTFCFACFTGARFSDVKNIQRDDIRGNTWHLRTLKTGKKEETLIIPLNGYAFSIIERHQDEIKPLKVISLSKMNKYIKEVCEMALINEPIRITSYTGSERKEETYKKFELVGTHTARRTFITLSLERGMSPEVVMSITGHKEYSTFKKYIRLTDKVKQSEMSRVWSNPNLKLIEKQN